jgi:hypothetical protein
MDAMATAYGLHKAIALQRTKIAQERRALHAEKVAQFRHPPPFFGLQRTEDGSLSGTNTVPAHTRVEELRDGPRRAADVKTRAIPYGRHVQLLLHVVYIHISGSYVNRFLFSGRAGKSPALWAVS